MGKVVDILKNTPHLQGKARCLACGSEWQAVVPEGVINLECPQCNLNRGVILNNCAFPEGAWVLTCSCTNQIFMIKEDRETLCVNCGKIQVI